MNTLRLHSLWFLIIAAFFIGGCVASSADSPADTPAVVKSFKDYPDHAFDAKEYILGMHKGGKNLLIWVDPTADFSKYKSVNVAQFGKRLLPVQNKFSYDASVATFNNSFQGGITLNKSGSSAAVKIVGEVVECNPGSRAARYWVGMGAGKSAGAVVCEIYLPGAPKPSMRIYARDTGSVGGFGGDSFAMLNHIFTQIGFRVANTVNTKIGH